eukprot:3233063-Rhodomonas_salina.1
MEQENNRMEQENLMMMKTYLEGVVTSDHLDDRERQLLKDIAINSLYKKAEGGGPRLITGAEGEGAEDEITISEV